MRATISCSVLARPGGLSAAHFHCIQRAEFVNVPSFSAKFAAGRRKTSVPIWFAGGPPYSVGAFQKLAVSVSAFSTTTIHFSFDSAAIIFFEFGPSPTGFMPKVMKPSGPGSLPPTRIDEPLYMSSKMYIHEYLPSIFGIHAKPQSLSFVDALPYNALS